MSLLCLSACGTPWSLTGDDLLSNPEDAALDTANHLAETGGGGVVVSVTEVACDPIYAGGAYITAEYVSDTAIGVEFGGVAAQMCSPLALEAEEHAGIVVITHSLVETDAECDDPTPCYYAGDIVVSGVSGPGLTVVFTPPAATP